MSGLRTIYLLMGKLCSWHVLTFDCLCLSILRKNSIIATLFKVGGIKFCTKVIVTLRRLTLQTCHLTHFFMEHPVLKRFSKMSLSKLSFDAIGILGFIQVLSYTTIRINVNEFGIKVASPQKYRRTNTAASENFCEFYFFTTIWIPTVKT